MYKDMNQDPSSTRITTSPIETVYSPTEPSAKAMGMKLIAYDPYISAERAEQIGCRLVELDALFREADYITLHVPKTAETANMIDAESLAKMKPTTQMKPTNKCQQLSPAELPLLCLPQLSLRKRKRSSRPSRRLPQSASERK